MVLLLGLLDGTLAGPWHAHEANSPGWRYLTPPERVQHQRRLRGFSTLHECKAYLEQHHRMLAERARARGNAFSSPDTDTCDELRQRGRLR